MATEIDIGGIKLTIGVDAEQLKKGGDEGKKALEGISDAGQDTARQLKMVETALNATGGSVAAFSTGVGGATTQGRKFLDTVINPFKGAIAEATNAWLASNKAMFDAAKFSETTNTQFSQMEFQMKKFGLSGGVVSGMMKKVGDDFIMIQNQSKQTGIAFNNAGNATGAMAAQMGEMAPQVAMVAQSMQLLTMGGVIGAVVVAATAAYNAIKKYGDSLISLGENADFANMSLVEYQKTQKALEISGGLSAEEFAAGSRAIAKNMFDATQSETTLSKFLEKNNYEFEKGGKLTATMAESIRTMADMIKNASDGAQKLRIAEAFGVDRKWVRALEDGGDAIDKIIDDLPKAGSLIDSEMIQKAKIFSAWWRQYSDEALTWIKAFVVDAATELKKIVDAKLGGDSQLKKDVQDLGLFFKLMMDPKSWMGENEDKFLTIMRRLKASAVADVTAMSTEIKSQFDQAFGDEETKRLIQDRIDLIKTIRGLKNEKDAIDAVSFESGGVYKPPPPKTEDPDKDDSKTEGLKRRLAQMKQQIDMMLGYEDKAIKDHEARLLEEMDRFTAAKLVKGKEAEDLKNAIDQATLKKTEELIVEKFETETATELELMDRKHGKILTKLKEFEDRKTINEERAAIDRKKINEKYELDKMTLAANAADRLAGIADSTMAAINDITGQGAKKGFTIMKGLAVATALVHGFAAALAAYRAGIEFGASIGNPIVGQAMGIAFAGIAAAGTGAMIAKIAGVGQNSGGGTVTGPGGGGGVAAAAAASGGGGGGPMFNHSMTVSGFKPGEMMSGEYVRDLAEKLLQFQRDGGVVLLK